jgi:2-iminobutanoate/2-iminopropanoate deaminase
MKGLLLISWKTCVVAACAIVLAGCSSAGSRFWVPQGAGEYQDTRAPASAPRTAQGQPAAASPGAARPPARAGIAAPAPSAALGGYTQASRYGDLLFVSGQIAVDPATGQLKGANVDEQTRAVMDNIRAILEAHRLTMANVVSVTVYLRDLHEFRAMDDAYESYFRGNLPSRSVIQAARLPRDALVEIAVIAGR